MFRLMRRAPWIALGAAGAYYLDGQNGSARRRQLAARAREWVDRAQAQWQERAVAPVDAPLAPSVPEDRVTARADAPLGAERAAGVSGSELPPMAEQILTESEWRVTDRAGTSGEHRRSEETVSGGG